MPPKSSKLSNSPSKNGLIKGAPVGMPGLSNSPSKSGLSKVGSKNSSSPSKPSKESGSKEPEEDVWTAPVKPGPKEPPVGEAARLARKFHLDLYECKHILKIFVEADDNDSGGLDKQEFTTVLRKVFELGPKAPVPKELLDQSWTSMIANAGAKGGQCEASAEHFLQWYTANMFSDMVREAAGSKSENESYDLARKHNTDVITIDKIRKRFDKFDLDGSGKIDYKEFLQMMVYVLKAKNAEDISDDRATRFWKEIDQDNSGAIEFSEFVAWFVKYFDVDQDDMDMSKGPVSKFYDSFNPLGKSVSKPQF